MDTFDFRFPQSQKLQKRSLARFVHLRHNQNIQFKERTQFNGCVDNFDPLHRYNGNYLDVGAGGMPLHSQFRSIWSVELEKTSTTLVDALKKPWCMAPSSYIIPFHNHHSQTTSAFHFSDSPNVIEHLRRCQHNHRTPYDVNPEVSTFRRPKSTYGAATAFSFQTLLSQCIRNVREPIQ